MTAARWTVLACYLAITIVVPALNGALHRSGFGEHLAIVIGGSVLVIGWFSRRRGASAGDPTAREHG